MTEIANSSEVKPAHIWLRALELTAAIPKNPRRILPHVIEELAERHGSRPALLSDRESFSFQDLAARMNQYTQWALGQGIGKGDVVGLLMTSRPEYFAAWLGISAAGGAVALLNTNLKGASLAHCIRVAHPGHLIVASEFADSLASAKVELADEKLRIWIHGSDSGKYSRIDRILQQMPASLPARERPQLSIDDLALYIYTSGTTGMPKAANVSHARVMQWSYWFAGMIGIQSEDRMYSCLPMYHSIGGVLVPGAALVAGGSVVLREGFSATQFWNEVAGWDCTLFQYIGEFCRYLLHAPVSGNERNHRIRIACGNGMSSSVWKPFQQRFQIPRILEFYASTEGGLSLFNVEGEPGAIGRVPPYLAHRFSPALVRFDPETCVPVRNKEGFCIPCAANEAGEALGRVSSDRSQAGGRYEGYTDSAASEGKLLRDVFEPGDTWVRTGDLMRKDERGFFYFVDRVGDTFRWKGENVSTTEVAKAVSSFPGVEHVIVYGVKVAGAEGRIGMVALVHKGDVDLSALQRHLGLALPSYARPAFFRVLKDFPVTGTFKYSKAGLVQQGFNPEVTSDAIYFNNPQTQALQPVDRTLYDRIQGGQVRL